MFDSALATHVSASYLITPGTITNMDIPDENIIDTIKTNDSNDHEILEVKLDLSRIHLQAKRVNHVGAWILMHFEHAREGRCGARHVGKLNGNNKPIVRKHIVPSETKRTLRSSKRTLRSSKRVHKSGKKVLNKS
ncbi:hypothetical protein KGF57_005147 [Candida theae]|uniref:Uncharacterized protein n=1 Tax=Candida theae TaxID=1198502 RepID=A0AAD5B9Z9_9ASCO|nr:uncharacterized protein KGF57_005147 [Candida theae]KAI5948749.1 hypothetical protein KGF57_005147 [Candida theae]